MARQKSRIRGVGVGLVIAATLPARYEKTVRLRLLVDEALLRWS